MYHGVIHLLGSSNGNLYVISITTKIRCKYNIYSKSFTCADLNWYSFTRGHIAVFTLSTDTEPLLINMYVELAIVMQQ